MLLVDILNDVEGGIFSVVHVSREQEAENKERKTTLWDTLYFAKKQRAPKNNLHRNLRFHLSFRISCSCTGNSIQRARNEPLVQHFLYETTHTERTEMTTLSWGNASEKRGETGVSKKFVQNDLPYRDSNPGLPGTWHSQGSESRIS